MPAAQEKAAPSSKIQRVTRSIELLNEALNYIDELGEYPEIGARLAALIDELGENIRRK
jgi:hypothetical protein